jgi:hypothetical protein
MGSLSGCLYHNFGLHFVVSGLSDRKSTHLISYDTRDNHIHNFAGHSNHHHCENNPFF